MGHVPMLQCAMDYISIAPALAMALRVAPEVDIIEIGTPLCKAEGLHAIRAMRELVPDKLILADFKSPDVGGLEAQMAFEAGADMMTVIGGAPLATVQQALDMARKMGKEMLMELTGVRDILARAKEWRQMGVERMVYHRGWDEQTHNRQWGEDDKVVIRQLIDMGFKVTVTGGLTNQALPFFADLAVSVVICGRGIREATDPRAAAAEFRATMHRLWGGGGAVAAAYEGGRVAGANVAQSGGEGPALRGQRDGSVAHCRWPRLPRLRRTRPVVHGHHDQHPDPGGHQCHCLGRAPESVARPKPGLWAGGGWHVLSRSGPDAGSLH